MLSTQKWPKSTPPAPTNPCNCRLGIESWQALLHLILSVQSTTLLDERRDDLSVPHHRGPMQGGLVPLQSYTEAEISFPQHPTNSSTQTPGNLLSPHRADWLLAKGFGHHRQGKLCGPVSRECILTEQFCSQTPGHLRSIARIKLTGLRSSSEWGSGLLLLPRGMWQ
jgi:hypothetical protein